LRYVSSCLWQQLDGPEVATQQVTTVVATKIGNFRHPKLPKSATLGLPISCHSKSPILETFLFLRATTNTWTAYKLQLQAAQSYQNWQPQVAINGNFNSPKNGHFVIPIVANNGNNRHFW